MNDIWDHRCALWRAGRGPDPGPPPVAKVLRCDCGEDLGKLLPVERPSFRHFTCPECLKQGTIADPAQESLEL